MTKRKAEAENRLAIARQYEPTQRERRAVEAYAERQQQRPPAPSLAVTNDDTTTVRVAIDHPDRALGEKLLANALGTTAPAFLPGLIEQLAHAGIKGETDREAQLNFMLSLVLGTEPRDQLETMLATHMAAVHNALMKTVRTFNGVTTIEQQDSASNALNKLARTFAIQVDTFKRYRTGGDQRVVVQHVNVADGGQAIVGNVTAGGRGEPKKPEATS